jgi:hypothetical protein
MNDFMYAAMPACVITSYQLLLFSFVGEMEVALRVSLDTR